MDTILFIKKLHLLCFICSFNNTQTYRVQQYKDKSIRNIPYEPKSSYSFYKSTQIRFIHVRLSVYPSISSDQTTSRKYQLISATIGWSVLIAPERTLWKCEESDQIYI